MSKLELIASKARLLSLAIAAFLLLWGGYGLYVNELLISSVEDGKPTYLMFAAFICGAMVLTAEIIDQAEIKNSETEQPSLGRYVGWGGWTLFGTIVALHFTLEIAQALFR